MNKTHGETTGSTFDRNFTGDAGFSYEERQMLNDFFNEYQKNHPKVYDPFVTIELAHTFEEIEKQGNLGLIPVVEIMIKQREKVQNLIDPSKLPENYIKDTQMLRLKYL